jgi:hypothetical protein
MARDFSCWGMRVELPEMVTETENFSVMDSVLERDG